MIHTVNTIKLNHAIVLTIYDTDDPTSPPDYAIAPFTTYVTQFTPKLAEHLRNLDFYLSPDHSTFTFNSDHLSAIQKIADAIESEYNFNLDSDFKVLTETWERFGLTHDSDLDDNAFFLQIALKAIRLFLHVQHESNNVRG